jgi:hypothetical protein
LISLNFNEIYVFGECLPETMLLEPERLRLPANQSYREERLEVELLMCIIQEVFVKLSGFCNG